MDGLEENEVIISGFSGSFPKADNVEEFMQKLFAKENLLRDVSYMPCKLGKLNNLDKFDAEFFGFDQPHRVNVMDPMARIILEKTYEAIIDSGNNPVTLKGKNCGVYIGLHFLETEMLVYEKIQKGASLAISRSFNANRISYWLGIHGPSFVVDSACSSTLLALEMAFKAIRNGECDSAIVGGCHVCLHPALLLHLLKVGVLNPKGESKVFDEDAAGFCKAESIGILYLQRARDARRVYARVVNVRSNHDGSKPLFLSPHGPSQAKLLKMVYDEANIDVNSVAWIEAHATGTLVGDKQEVTAIDNVFADRQMPLLIGSVKSNMGHAEAAAGIGSISKVIIAMETGFIPPNINITNLRKDIDAFKSGRIKVVTERTPWNGGIVGVSGFGMGGANTHVILESFRKEKINHGIPDDFLPRIVCISGRTEEAVEVLLNYLEMTSLDAEFIGLLHQVHNYNIPGHPYRGFTILQKNERCLIKKMELYDDQPRQLVFVFTSYISDWSNIYRSLIDMVVFQETIDKCSIILNKYNVNLVNILDNCSVENTLFNGFISAITIQLALCDLMNSLKVKPDFIIGYSIGELVCAYADQCLTLEETVETAYHCSAFLAKRYRNTSDTVTIVVDKEYTDLKGFIPRNLILTFPSIISGPNHDISAFLAINHLRNITVLNEDFHTSPANDPTELENILKMVIHPKPNSRKWICSFIYESKPEINSAYFVKGLTSDVNMEIFTNLIPNCAIAIEFLSTKFFNIIKHLKGEGICIPLVVEDRTVNVTDILSALGELYLYGRNPHFCELYPTVMYPVSRGTKMISPLIKWNHTTSWPVAFSSLQERMLSGERKVSIFLDEKTDAFLSGHEINSAVVYPATGYLILAWESLALIHGKIYHNLPVVFESVRFLRAVNISQSEPVIFNIMVRKSNGDFEILESNNLVACGRIYISPNIQKERTAIKTPLVDDSVILDEIDFYRYILINGYNYKGAFRSISQINSKGTRAKVKWNQNWVTYLDGLLQLNMLDNSKDCTTVPIEIEKIVIDTEKHNIFVERNVTEFDVLMDKELNIIESVGVEINGCIFRPVASKMCDEFPLIQKYSFIPYLNSKQIFSVKHVVHLFMQIITDYLDIQKTAKIAEIIDSDLGPSRSFLSLLFSNFVKEHPLIQAEVKAYFSNNVDFKKSKGDMTNIYGKLPLGDPVHVIACVDVFNDNKLRLVYNSLEEGGFLIARQHLGSNISVPSNWCVCCDVTTKLERFILLKKKPEFNKNLFKIVSVSSVTYDWIEELQKVLKINFYERIILVSEHEPFSGILGFYHCLRKEHGTDHIRCFFLRDDVSEKFSLENEFYKSQVSKDLAINVLKNGEWGCYARQATDIPQPVKTYHAFLEMKNCGKKQILQWVQGPLQSLVPSENENLIHVYYAAVNSSDVLLFRNRLAPGAVVKDILKKDYIFGKEFSGRSNTGKRYMGLLSHGCLSTFIELNSHDIFVNEVPNNWSLEDAVTVPLAYYVAVYALVVCSKVKNRESVLIHSAGTTISQAAINVAIYYGCEIFVTVSSIDEKIFIKENFSHIPDIMIGNSEDSSFEHLVMQKTQGKGVDIVLNSLPVNKLGASVNCLAQHGRFIQMKKSDLRNGNLNVNKLLVKSISMYSAVLEDIFDLDADKKLELKEILDRHIQTSAVKPLVRTVYCYTGVESSFEFASCSRNLGKCIVQLEPEEEELKVKPQPKIKEAYPRFMCKSDRTYVVCGGLGGMGMELVNWLITRGAKKILISSRQGVTKGSQQLRLNKWKCQGVNVIVSHLDISVENEAAELLEEAKALGIIDGIFNVAGVLKDKMFKNQTAENFRYCASPKLHGTYNLDRISRLQCPELEKFVVFSSVACSYGSLGQTNYGMFNSTIERICERRHEENLPAIAVEWGAVGNVGMLVSHLDGNVEKFQGCRMQSIKSCLEVLDRFLCQKNPIVVSLIVADK